MTASPSQRGVSMRAPPVYFDRIHSDASALWAKLEADPVRGTVATANSCRFRARAMSFPSCSRTPTMVSQDCEWTIANSVFEFTHDGSDFTADQFQSLCRFG